MQQFYRDKLRVYVAFIFFCTGPFAVLPKALAQRNVGIGTTTPNPHAVLDVVSPTGNQGLLAPRLTATQRNALTTALSAADNGLIVFDTSDNTFYYWKADHWERGLGTSSGSGTGITGITAGTGLSSTISGSNVTLSISNGGVGTPQLASKSVTTNNIADNAVTNSKIVSVDPAKLTSGGAAAGHVLTWNAVTNQWVPQNPAPKATRITVNLASLTINGTGTADVTFSFPGASAGATVIVTPTTDLTASVAIGYAYVSSAGSIKVRFINTDNKKQTITATPFSITVIP